MRSRDQEIFKRATGFAGRWGFLSKNIFFEYFCDQCKSQKYLYWRLLVSRGYFYTSVANPDFALLTRKGRSFIGGADRQARLSVYFRHDEIVADVMLTLEKTKLLGQSFLEYELQTNQATSYTLFGASRLFRLPDVAFDLKADSKPIRCALEIENTKKSYTKYNKMALAYSGYRDVDLVLFVCATDMIEKNIQKAFNNSPFKQQGRAFGTISIDDFKNNKLEAKVRFLTNEFTIRQTLEKLTKKTVAEPKPIAELKQNPFCDRNKAS